MSTVLDGMDHRLLHGTMATMRVPQSGAQRMIVVDNHTANDPIVKESMRLGKPTDMACSITTEETAMKNFKAGKHDDHKVSMACEDPGVFLKLQEAGQKAPGIIIGITRNRDSGARVNFRAFMKDEEKPIYKKLMENRCEMDVQLTTTDKAVKLSRAMEL